MTTFITIALALFIALGIFVTLQNQSNKSKLASKLEEQTRRKPIETPIPPQRPDTQELTAKSISLAQETTRLIGLSAELSSKISSKTEEQWARLDRGEITYEEVEAIRAADYKLMSEIDEKIDASRREYDLVTQKIRELDDRYNEEYREYERKSEEAIEASEPEIVAYKSFFSGDGLSGIAIDLNGKKLSLLTPDHHKIISYEEIVSSEVIVDSETVIRTDRTGQVGGALAGGLIAGGVGAIVMAMGAKRKEVEKVNSIDLMILTTSPGFSRHKVNFYTAGSFSTPKIALSDASEWHDLISIAIHHNNKVKG